MKLKKLHPFYFLQEAIGLTLNKVYGELHRGTSPQNKKFRISKWKRTFHNERRNKDNV